MADIPDDITLMDLWLHHTPEGAAFKQQEEEEKERKRLLANARARERRADIKAAKEAAEKAKEEAAAKEAAACIHLWAKGGGVRVRVKFTANVATNAHTLDYIVVINVTIGVGTGPTLLCCFRDEPWPCTAQRSCRSCPP